jgi:hypothetical protein
MKLGGVVVHINDIRQLKFWVKIPKGAYSMGVQSFEKIASPANYKCKYVWF